MNRFIERYISRTLGFALLYRKHMYLGFDSGCDFYCRRCDRGWGKVVFRRSARSHGGGSVYGVGWSSGWLGYGARGCFPGRGESGLLGSLKQCIRFGEGALLGNRGGGGGGERKRHSAPAQEPSSQKGSEMGRRLLESASWEPEGGEDRIRGGVWGGDGEGRGERQGGWGGGYPSPPPVCVCVSEGGGSQLLRLGSRKALPPPPRLGAPWKHHGGGWREGRRGGGGGGGGGGQGGASGRPPAGPGMNRSSPAPTPCGAPRRRRRRRASTSPDLLLPVLPAGRRKMARAAPQQQQQQQQESSRLHHQHGHEAPPSPAAAAAAAEGAEKRGGPPRARANGENIFTCQSKIYTYMSPNKHLPAARPPLQEENSGTHHDTKCQRQAPSDPSRKGEDRADSGGAANVPVKPEGRNDKESCRGSSAASSSEPKPGGTESGLPAAPKSSADAATEKQAPKKESKGKPGPRRKAQGKTPQNRKLTDYYPVRRSSRKSKTELQIEEKKRIDDLIERGKEDGMKVDFIDGKGRGVIATRSFARGEFVVEYHGDLIEITDAKKREAAYAQDPATGCYMYYFQYLSKTYCVDATKETGRLGRLINHSKCGNCQTKLHDVAGTPHLILVASRDIRAGEELLYDYGDRSKASLEAHPWLKH